MDLQTKRRFDTQCIHAEKFVDLVTSLTKNNVTFYPPNSPNKCHSILYKVIIVASHENTIFALGPENSLSTCKIQTKHCKVAATKVKVFIAKLKLKAKICFHIKSWEDLCVPTCYQDLFPTYKENRTGLIRCDTKKMKRTDLANLAVHNWPKMRKMRPVKGCY